MKRILLDENLPRPLVKHFSSAFEVSTVSTEGWASKKNGELLAAMTNAGFEYLLTVDRNPEYQQNLNKYLIRLVVLVTYDDRYKTLVNHVPTIEKAIDEMRDEQTLLHIDLRSG